MCADRLLLTLVLCLLALGPAVALDAPVVELSATPTTVPVGSPVEVTVTYRWPAEWEIESPDPGATFATSFVIDSPPPERWRTGQEAGERWRLRLLAQRSGVWELPRPHLRARHAGTVHEAQAPLVVIQVGTEAAPAVPAPPRALWLSDDLPRDDAPWWIAAAVAAVLALGLGAFAWWWPRRQIDPPIPPIRALHEELGNALGGDGKEAGARVSRALRRFCGDTFGFDGPATTARECSARLRAPLADDEHRDVSRLLDQLDALRWAADDLGVSVVEPLRSQALAWAERVQERLDREAAEAAAQHASAKSAKAAS